MFCKLRHDITFHSIPYLSILPGLQRRVIRRTDDLLIILILGLPPRRLNPVRPPTLLIGDGEELPRRPLLPVDGALQDPVPGSGTGPGLDEDVRHLEHLLQVDGDGDVVEVGAVLQGRGLPPLAGAVDSVLDGVGFGGGARVAEAALARLGGGGDERAEDLWKDKKWNVMGERAPEGIPSRVCRKREKTSDSAAVKKE